MLEEFLNDQNRIDDSISVVESVRRSLTRVPHNHINVIYLLREFMKEGCKNYLEIGVYHGGSMITSMMSKYPCNFYGVDFFGVGPNNIFDRAGNQSAHELTFESVNKNIENLNVNNHKYELFQMDSQLESTFNFLSKKLKYGVDLLMIDYFLNNNGK